MPAVLMCFMFVKITSKSEFEVLVFLVMVQIFCSKEFDLSKNLIFL